MNMPQTVWARVCIRQDVAGVVSSFFWDGIEYEPEDGG